MPRKPSQSTSTPGSVGGNIVKQRATSGPVHATIGAPITAGRASRRLPRRLAEAYEQAIHDPELLSYQDDVALLTAQQTTLLDELTAYLDEAEEPAWWRDYNAAQLSNLAQRTGTVLSLEEVFRQRLVEVHKLRTEAVSKHQKAETARHLTMNVKEAEALVAYLLTETRRLVRDVGDRNALIMSVVNFLRGRVMVQPDHYQRVDPDPYPENIDTIEAEVIRK